MCIHVCIYIYNLCIITFLIYSLLCTFVAGQAQHVYMYTRVVRQLPLSHLLRMAVGNSVDLDSVHGGRRALEHSCMSGSYHSVIGHLGLAGRVSWGLGREPGLPLHRV